MPKGGNQGQQRQCSNLGQSEDEAGLNLKITSSPTPLKRSKTRGRLKQEHSRKARVGTARDVHLQLALFFTTTSMPTSCFSAPNSNLRLSCSFTSSSWLGSAPETLFPGAGLDACFLPRTERSLIVEGHGLAFGPSQGDFFLSAVHLAAGSSLSDMQFPD